ncbi:MAG: DUF1778 domain-containing protein [Cytophagaceae bacterium]|nr:MAG: DUF1778 domain-containing protein [Cytophagaceae bacterium]
MADAPSPYPYCAGTFSLLRLYRSLEIDAELIVQPVFASKSALTSFAFIIVLSERQCARFVAILEDPAPPTPALVKAMEGYQETKAPNPDRGL